MATIRLTTKFFPLAFLLFFFPARAVVDGEEQKVGWFKTTDLPVSPGTHRLRVYFPYLIPREAGSAEIEVPVAEGQTVNVSYRAPLLVFLAGKIKIA
jgi:hypothetical protein